MLRNNWPLSFMKRAGGGGGGGAFDRWRLRSRLLLAGFTVFHEVEMRATPGGADQCTGGTASASSTNGGNVAANAFDNNSATAWSSAGATLPQWLEYQFPSAVDVEELAILPGNLDQVAVFEVQYYDEANWQTDWTHFTPAWASSVNRVLPKTSAFTLGAERVTDPSFDVPASWTTSGGWSISGGNAVGTSASDSLAQSGVFELGKYYLIEFPYTMSAGLRLRIQSDRNTNLHLTGTLGASGTISEYIKADGTQLNIEADGAVFTGTIPQISVKELVPLLGTERVTDPSFNDPGSWTGTNGWSVSGGNAVGTAATDQLLRTGVFTSGKIYQITMTYTMSSGSKLRIRTEASANAAITPTLYSSGTVTVYFAADGTELHIEADTAAFTGTISDISVKEIL